MTRQAPECSQHRAGEHSCAKLTRPLLQTAPNSGTPHVYMQTGNYVHRPSPNYLLFVACVPQKKAGRISDLIWKLLSAVTDS